MGHRSRSTRPVLAIALMLILCFVAVEMFVPQVPQRGMVESFLETEQNSEESFLYNDTGCSQPPGRAGAIDLAGGRAMIARSIKAKAPGFRNILHWHCNRRADRQFLYDRVTALRRARQSLRIAPNARSATSINSMTISA